MKSQVKWFQLISMLLAASNAIADSFIKNEQSKQAKDAVIGVATAVVNGLAYQNPDGAPASLPFDEVKGQTKL